MVQFPEFSFYQRYSSLDMELTIPPSTPEVKNEWSCISTPLHSPIACAVTFAIPYELLYHILKESGLNGCCTAMWKANGKTTTLSLFLDSLFLETEIPCMRNAWRQERFTLI
jgi:hypothetical protein